MIKAAFYIRNGHYIGFSVTGHAGFDEEGHDIVCASVSALTVNTVNSLEKFTSDRVITEYCDDGMVKCKLTGNVSPEGELLIKSLRLGLCDIYKQYEDEYIRVFIREVN
jgi:hypothetical protein